jgi:hypothetical protein
VDLLNAQLMGGELDGYKSFVDQCLSEYDLNGWRVPTSTPSPLSVARPATTWPTPDAGSLAFPWHILQQSVPISAPKATFCCKTCAGTPEIMATLLA